ncbi:MAG: hypothetical protein WC621_02995 [Patescibacteria group bacterium]
MKNPGLFIVFESPPKCGKTTLAIELVKLLRNNSKQIIRHKRGALSNSPFSSEVKSKEITDLGYSTAFYWADCIFDTSDSILPSIARGETVVQERYDLSITTFREIHNLNADSLLLDEYLRRNLLINPHLTIILQANPDIILKRIKDNSNSTEIDHLFFNKPDLISTMQERLIYHVTRLHRNYLMLDTEKNSINECLSIISQVIPIQRS